MLSLSKFGLSEYSENRVIGSFSLNNSEIFRLSFQDTFLGTLDTYTKNKPALGSSGGGCTVRYAGPLPNTHSSLGELFN